MNQSSNKIFIGTMSGTSFDGIDVCAISETNKVQLIDFDSYKYPRGVKKEIANVIENQKLGLKEYGELNIKIALAFSKAINSFIKNKKILKANIAAIGLSGQTLWHNPAGKYPFSIQAGDPKIVMKKCSIDVVSDFRNDHIKLGGKGAPLVPEFHQKIFSSPKNNRLIVNIGGISNYSYLIKSKSFMGSDCGPGNALMDWYCQKNLNRSFDKDGNLAKKGKIHLPSLKTMLDDPFFKKRYPKSTGKEIFNQKFIPKQLLKKSPEIILATLTELSALSISRAIKSKEKFIKNLIVCGGGINNIFLMERIAHNINVPIISSNKFGFNPQAIESMAFGWLAKQRIEEQALYVNNKKGLLGYVTKAI